MTNLRGTSISQDYQAKAENFVSSGIALRQSGDKSAAAEEYKKAILLFINAQQIQSKEQLKKFIQMRIDSVLKSLNEIESEMKLKKLTQLDDLMKKALDQGVQRFLSESQVQRESRTTIAYPQLNIPYPATNGSDGFDNTVPTVDCIPVPTHNQNNPYPQLVSYPPLVDSTELYGNNYNNNNYNNNNNNDSKATDEEKAKKTDNNNNKKKDDVEKPSNSSTSTSGSSRTHKKTHRDQPAALSDRVINLALYERIRVLGRGSFGLVYLVEDKETHQQYAVKELLSLETMDDQISFLREVEALTQANHYAVLHLHGFSMKISPDNPVPAIVTEYLPGGSLQDVIDGRKKMNTTQIMVSIYGIAAAMKYLHGELRIVHRDLKPANVMLNNRLEPVVGDFGLAKIMKQAQMRQTHAAGSPVYMAPELMERKEYSDKVDVYSYGIMLYELLTGKLAFVNIQSLADLVEKVVNGVRPPVDELEIPQAFKDLMVKCWSPEPADRPSFSKICHYMTKKKIILNGIDMKVYDDYIAKVNPRKK